MQGMSSDVQVRVQCWYASTIAGAAARSLLAQHVGNMLYGMQGMSSDVPEVRSVLGMLPRLFSCKEPLKVKRWNMLYGMQGMSSDVPECVQCWVCFLDCWAAAGSR
jgi:hypothetical protein